MGVHSAEFGMTGTIQLRRIGRFTFPTDELVTAGRAAAHLSRDSSLTIFFGRGRRVTLADGTEWRIKAATLGRHIVPVIKSASGTVAYSGPLQSKRSYGITGKEYGYTLLPLGRIGLRRPGLWTLRQHETDIARIDDRRRIIHAAEPIPIAATLLVFTLVIHGIPGEANLLR